MTAHGWSLHLDDLERSIASQREQLRVAEPTEVLSVPDATPSPALGPLAPTHRDRAVRLLAELELLQDELRAARDRTGRELSAARRATKAIAAPVPSYVDSYS